MLFVDQQHVVEQLAACAADEPLRDRVHVRRANRRADHLRADTFGRAVERGTELAVAIAKQDGWSVPVDGGVAHLLCRPRLRRVPGRGDVDARRDAKCTRKNA